MALAGLLGPPLVIVTILAALYAHYGDIAALTRILGGIASAAAGLLIASVVKMLEPMFRKWNFAPFVAIVGFIAVALIRWPLPIVFAVLAPVSVVLAWVTMRR
jgi:chromate transporter